MHHPIELFEVTDQLSRLPPLTCKEVETRPQLSPSDIAHDNISARFFKPDGRSATDHYRLLGPISPLGLDGIACG